MGASRWGREHTEVEMRLGQSKTLWLSRDKGGTKGQPQVCSVQKECFGNILSMGMKAGRNQQ